MIPRTPTTEEPLTEAEYDVLLDDYERTERESVRQSETERDPAATRRPPRYRVSGDAQTCTVTIYRDPYGCTSKPEVRHYWRPLSGGYVRDVTDRPGTLGTQVCDRMASTGDTLHCPDGCDLTEMIRREMRLYMADGEVTP